jgi:hypothetical protein
LERHFAASSRRWPAAAFWCDPVTPSSNVCRIETPDRGFERALGELLVNLRGIAAKDDQLRIHYQYAINRPAAIAVSQQASESPPAHAS